MHVCRARLTIMATLLAAALAVPGARAAVDEPLGIVVWTDLNGTTPTVRYHVFTPSDHFPTGWPRDGTFKYDAKELTGGDQFSFMHPAFDHTGVRLLFSSGRAMEPNLALPPATSPGPTAPKTRILKFNLTTLNGEDFASGSGWQYFFNPAPDHTGNFVFCNQFEMGPSATTVGFKVQRRGFSDGSATPLPELDGALWPVLSLDDTKLAFAKRLTCQNVNPGTPIAIGLFVADVDPANGAVSNVRSLTPEFPDAPGNTFPGCCAATPQAFAGPIRVGRAAWGPDNSTLVFAMQDARYKSTDPSWNLWKTDLAAPGTFTLLGPESKTSDEFWPSVSADGLWVSYLTHTLGTKKYEAWVAKVDGLADARIVPGQGAAGVALWPAFDQDNDPPNLEVRLTFGDSNEYTQFTVVDKEPDLFVGGECRDRFGFYLKGDNFNPNLSTKCTPATSVELEWSKPSTDLPAKLLIGLTSKAALMSPPPPTILGGEFHCHTDAAWFKPTNPTALPAEYNQVVDGIFMEEGVRLKINVLARDGRYLRPTGTVDADPTRFIWDSIAASYDDSSAEGGGVRNADPPYFPLITKQQLEDKYPGVTWWIEDKTTGAFIERTDGTPFHIFRKPNYPPSAAYPEYSQSKPYRLRVVAQDLWLNRTELSIPIWVWDTKDKVKGLDYGTQRQK